MDRGVSPLCSDDPISKSGFSLKLPFQLNENEIKTRSGGSKTQISPITETLRTGHFIAMKSFRI